MKPTCWCGLPEANHQTLTHHFDPSEATRQAYCEMFQVALKDHKNNYSWWNALKNWLIMK